MLKTKSIFSPIDPKQDGLRILASRFRGRGMPVDWYDVWMPSLGPSEQLLKAFQAKEITWLRFSRDFRAEVFMDGPVDSLCRTIKNHGQKFTLRLIKQLAKNSTVTLMCQCPEDEKQCHRHVLKEIINSRLI